MSAHLDKTLLGAQENRYSAVLAVARKAKAEKEEMIAKNAANERNRQTLDIPADEDDES